MMKVLVDAELILGFFLNNEYASDAERILQMAESGQIEIYITEICLDKIRSEDERRAKLDPQLKRIADDIDKLFNVIPCDIREFLLDGVLGQLVDKRLIECAIEAACAKSKNLNAIFTHKPEDFEGSNLPVNRFIFNEFQHIVVEYKRFYLVNLVKNLIRALRSDNVAQWCKISEP